MTKNQEMMTLGEQNEASFLKMVEYCTHSGMINQNLYVEYDVKRGLRDSTGRGVLTGLTEISDVVAMDIVEGRRIPAEGNLYYQGYNVKDLLEGNESRRFRFEETSYLLLFGKLPTRDELDEFIRVIYDLQELSGGFVRDVIMRAANENIMNSLQRSILTLYSYDPKPDDISVENVLLQSLQLIAKMPVISAYAYYSYRHFKCDDCLIIRKPSRNCSIAENLLRMIRDDGHYTELEAQVLDMALVLHAEHGGGNNSTFTTHVVTSSGTDTYSAIAAAIASLKGPRHGGANLKVQQMMQDIKANVKDWKDEDEVREYLQKILNKQAFDGAGLIYGMGHAVYTLSDPREVILKKGAKDLAEEKGLMDEFELLDLIERLAPPLVQQQRKMQKPICANVDFYSGFLYCMLGIPEELFTPIFATARISGWCAHRLEELVNRGKIIRPAYRYVGHHRDYQLIDERKEISFNK
ncbi:MAG: citrate/2-methylcitrate synthase [Lachnospiraceae bacterium]